MKSRSKTMVSKITVLAIALVVIGTTWAASGILFGTGEVPVIDASDPANARATLLKFPVSPQFQFNQRTYETL